MDDVHSSTLLQCCPTASAGDWILTDIFDEWKNKKSASGCQEGRHQFHRHINSNIWRRVNVKRTWIEKDYMSLASCYWKTSVAVLPRQLINEITASWKSHLCTTVMWHIRCATWREWLWFWWWTPSFPEWAIVGDSPSSKIRFGMQCMWTSKCASKRLFKQYITDPAKPAMKTWVKVPS